MKELLFILLVGLGLAGCGKANSSEVAEAHGHEAKAAEFKKGQGVLLSAEAAEFIGLRRAEAQVKSARVFVPSSATLRTSEGDFVFVANGPRWLRAQVKLGATSADSVEVVDGLLEGDVIAISGAHDLWLAELQATKGGVGCADSR